MMSLSLQLSFCRHSLILSIITGTIISSHFELMSHLPEALTHILLPILIEVFPPAACTIESSWPISSEYFKNNSNSSVFL